MVSRAEQVACEDVLLFVNAATASTGQREFASTAAEHTLSLEFLHAYVLGNYRDLYAATLALGINDHNAALVVLNLLRTPSDPTRRAAEMPHPVTVEDHDTEGTLIAARLAQMPPQRVYRLFSRLRRAGVNNRRTRAVVRDWVTARPDLAFDAVKYRRGLADAARHAHLRLPAEISTVLFDWRRPARYATPLLETWRRAHYDRSALAELPYTVAEGFAARRGVSREKLLATARLTAAERLRLQGAAAKAKTDVAVDLTRVPLTRLATYVLSLDRHERAHRRAELTAALRASARRAAGPHQGTWGRVVTVCDDSYSSYGSGVKRRRPLAVALAVHYLVEALAAEHHGLWLTHRGDPLLVHPVGTTPLASRLLDALALVAPNVPCRHMPSDTSCPPPPPSVWCDGCHRIQPRDRVVVVSDAWDNDPPGGAGEVLRVWRQRLDPTGRTEVVHLNPVYDPRTYQVRPLAPGVPSVGIRNGEDAATLVEIARFATGTARFDDLVGYLRHQAGGVASLEPDEIAELVRATAGDPNALERVRSGQMIAPVPLHRRESARSGHGQTNVPGDDRPAGPGGTS
ncbi:MAG: hypothetical protein FWH11_11190 [Micrococcales bacterium]|nr:hypothetical protein [Micrococcales bacterium]